MKSYTNSVDPKLFEWMVKPTPQKDWIQGPGICLWLAFFFSEIGAGLYFLSLFFNYFPGYLVGWLLTLVVGGLVHMGYLGKPQRAFRIFAKPRTSELSRGMWVILIFAILGILQMLPAVFSGLPWSGTGAGYRVVMGIVCILLIMHGFATMNVVRALPSWNSSVILPLSIISGIWVGSQILEFMFALGGQNLIAIEMWSRIFLFVYIGILIFYLWGTIHESETAAFSIKELLKGDFAMLFYLTVVVIGIIVPLLLTFIMWGSSVVGSLVFLRLLSVLVGDVMLRYSIMRSAFYTPLL
jgi:DMSO reductase anchor subunit